MTKQLNDPIKTGIKIDFNSFSEAEKLLFAKVDEIEEKYTSKAPATYPKQ